MKDRAARLYFVLQGVCCISWWAWLVSGEDRYQSFFIDATIARALMPADGVLVGLGGLAAAWVWRRRHPAGTAIVSLHTGGVAYGAIVAWTQLLAAFRCWPGAVIMTVALVMTSGLLYAHVHAEPIRK